ncbi:glutathione S-transferase family protein [Fulvimarina endophytica]|nr:glutathione S-transferase family protein [Fulvimarina endophytica]
MHLFVNTTSPFVRIVRIAIAEKGLRDRIGTEIVDPWADPADFLSANPAGRVPTLALENGTALAESHFILRYLDEIAPEPAIYPAKGLAEALATAAPAYGAMDAATAIIIGRKSAEDFDTGMVGQKRWRSMAEGLKRLDANPPCDFATRVDIGNIVAVTALDYILFRYTDRDWLAELPTLAEWRERQKGRASIDETMPYIAG